MAIQAIVPRATGQWFDSADGQHWWFDSGSLALDFAYTGAMEPRGARATAPSPAESLHAPADLDAWLADRFPGLNSACSERELTDAKVLRRAIARLAVSASDGDASAPGEVDIINLFAATPDLSPVLEGGSRQAGRGRARATQALSSIARDAVRLFGAGAGGRIHECSADDCSIIYLDTSRGNSRRWCSMQRCGNRAKVRAHRARAAQPHEVR